MILTHLLIFAVFCSLASSPGEKRKITCYFSVPRVSKLEKVERSHSMKVSSGTCSADLIRAEDLMRISPSRQYYGAFDEYDLIMTRGDAEYRMHPDNADDLQSDVYICRHHVEELGYNWDLKKYPHIRYHKTPSGKQVVACSYPIEPHNVHLDHIKAFHLTRDETKAYLAATGIHLHIGLPVCKEHHELILSRIAEAKEESCDRNYGDTDDPMGDGEPEHTALKNAFFSFCKEAEIDRVCPKLSFSDYTRDTQTRKQRNIERIWWTTLELVVPGSEMEMWDRVCKTGNYREWDNFGREAASLILPEIAHLYMLADDARTRDIILSQAAGPLTYSELLPYFPGLSSYKFNNAKRIWASQELPPEVTITRTRWSDEKSMYFVHYLTSPHMWVQYPTGVRKAKFSTGEKVDIPNVIRNFGQAETIRHYRAFMESQGLGDKVYSDSTMIRMLRACPASQRHAMTCLDYFKAASYEAFDGIEAMLDRIVAMGKMSKDGEKERWFNFLEIRLYLKHDYILHVKNDSRVADHSLLFALSDPYNPKFAVQPAHPHDLQCPRCIHGEKTFRELHDYLSNLILTDPDNEKEYKEMLFNLANYQEAIMGLKKHEMRYVYTTLVKDNFIVDLPENHAFITADYGQKVIPTKCYETQCEYYAKKGIPWHFLHTTANISGVLVQHLGIHLVDDDPQNSMSTVSIITAYLKVLKVAGITAVHIRSDNAPNYHCTPTLASIISMSKESGVEILDWSFSEVQYGKGPADRGCANAKFKVRKEVKNKGKVESQRDLFDILTKEPLMPGVSIYLAEVTAPASQSFDSEITRVTDYSHFKKEGDHLRVWKYYGIGEGVVFKDLYSNAGVYKELKRGGFLVDATIAAEDRERIKKRQPALFWHYDPKALETKETGDQDQDTAVELQPEPTKDGKKGLAFACKLNVLGFELTSEEVAVSYASKPGAGCEGFESASNATTIVMLDCNLDEELENEGMIREVVNRVQRLRKEAKLVSTDEATVYIEFPAKAGKVRALVEAEKARLEAATGTPIHIGGLPDGKKASLTQETDVKEEKIKLHLVSTVAVGGNGVNVVDGKKKVNVKVETEDGRKITYNEFLYEVRSALDHWNGTMKLKLPNGEVMKYTTDIPSLVGSTLTVV